MADLSALEYPRHMHKGEESRVVRSLEAAEVAVKDGFTVEYVSADEAAARAAVVVDEPKQVGEPKQDEPEPKKGWFEPKKGTSKKKG